MEKGVSVVNCPLNQVPVDSYYGPAIAVKDATQRDLLSDALLGGGGVSGKLSS